LREGENRGERREKRGERKRREKRRRMSKTLIVIYSYFATSLW